MRNGDLRGLWATLFPTHEAWSGAAVLPEVRCHVDMVRKVTATRRDVWIAREVSCSSSGTVSVQWHLTNGKGQDMELLMALASGSKRRHVAQTCENTHEKY